jgi:hypothetical protein
MLPSCFINPGRLASRSLFPALAVVLLAAPLHAQTAFPARWPAM